MGQTEGGGYAALAELPHDHKVALKVLRPELAAVLGAERFLAEIRTTASLESLLEVRKPGPEWDPGFHAPIRFRKA